MKRRWQLLEAPPDSFLEQHPELMPIVAHLLYHRNIRTQEQMDEFLAPDYTQDVHDPFLFKDMHKAVQRLFQAIEHDEHITVHGDYDADGVSASAILTDTLHALGAKNLDVFLPHRETDGYGLNPKTIHFLAEKGTDVIITCDCGISNHDEVALANESGIDVIITDHHTIPAALPDAYAIIHPKIETEPYPDKNLAGGGVAFKLAQALLRTHRATHETLPNGETHQGFEKWLLDMVAISSVADMVPLLGESRTLTRFGLIVLNKTRRIGLQKLLLEARLLSDDGTSKREIDADTIGFTIAPRINAAGRLNHANVAYQLLTTTDPEQAAELAFQLDQNNKDRQQMVDRCVTQAQKQAEEQKDSPILFLLDPSWNMGIVGLIASRVKERHQKPTIAMTEREGAISGSGRSIEGFNMIHGLQQMPDLFSKFGGHPMACGFTLASPASKEKFIQQLVDLYAHTVEPEMTIPTIAIDAEVNLEEINWELYDLLEKFKPFGQANPKPKYMAKNLTVVKTEAVGKNGKHLRLLVKHNTHVVRKTIGWRLCGDETDNKENWATLLQPGDKIDMVFEVEVNQWNGNRELQLTIIDLHKSETTL